MKLFPIIVENRFDPRYFETLIDELMENDDEYQASVVETLNGIANTNYNYNASYVIKRFFDSSFQEWLHEEPPIRGYSSIRWSADLKGKTVSRVNRCRQRNPGMGCRSRCIRSCSSAWPAAPHRDHLCSVHSAETLPSRSA